MALTDVDSFFNNLYTIKNNIQFENYCLIEIEYIRNCYSTSNSIKTVFTKYKNKSLNYKFTVEKQKIIKNIFKLKKEESNKIRNDYAIKVSDKLKILNWIYSVDDYINISVNLIKSVKLLDNIVGLAALTGRRVGEIGCTAFFKYKTIEYVLFEGQLKTKERDDVEPYCIPILYNSNEIIKVLNKVRYEMSKFNNKPVLFHDTCSKTISSIVKNSYSDVLQGEVMAKDLRASYACIANDKFNDGSVGITRYIATILGHGENDNNTCNSYMKYRLE